MISLVTAAVAEPVSVAEFKLHARIDISDEDQDIALKLRAARQMVERATNRALLTSTWDLYLDSFPGRDYIELPKGQLQSITSLTYTDSDGNASTFSTDNYEADTVREPGRLVLKYGKTWPSVTLKTVNPIKVRFVAGWTRLAGTVGTSDATVTHASGDQFDTATLPETPIMIDGAVYLISSVTSGTVLTLTSTSAGSKSGVSYSYNKVDSLLKGAIHWLAKYWYEQRDAVVIGDRGDVDVKVLPMAFATMISNYRLNVFGGPVQ